MITHYTGPHYNVHGREYAEDIAATASDPHAPQCRCAKIPAIHHVSPQWPRKYLARSECCGMSVHQYIADVQRMKRTIAAALCIALTVPILAGGGIPRLYGTGCIDRPLGFTLAIEESDITTTCAAVRPIFGE